MRTRHVLASTVLVLSSLTATAAAAPPTSATVPDGAAAAERVAGDDRAATAALAALEAFPDGATQALIARSDAFPDALAAAYLAGVYDYPVLLTDGDEIPFATTSALDALGVERVTLLGLEGAIPEPIAVTFLETYGPGNVGRLGGNDRYATAALIAAEGEQVGLAPNLADPTGEPLRTAVLSLGTNFPDALSAGPLAFANRHPILLTDQASLPDATRLALEDTTLDIEQVIVTGGEVAVSQSVLTAVAAIDSIESVTRVAGDTREATAVAMGVLTRTALGWPADSIALATGRSFPDALSLAPLAARTRSTLFLAGDAGSLGFDTFLGIHALCGAVDALVVAGGRVAVSDTAVEEARLATTCATSAFPIDGAQFNAATADGPVAGSGGDGLGLLFSEDDRLCYAVGMQDPASFGPVQLGEGVAATPGPVLATLDRPSVDGFAAGCLTEAELADGAPPIAELTREVANFPSGYHLLVDGSTSADGQSQAIEGATSRGQLAPIGLTIPMSGDLEVTQDDDGTFTGLVDDPASGTAELTLFPVGDQLCFSIDVDGLGSPTDPLVAGGLHLHEGAADQNGPIVLPLSVGPVGRTDFLHTACLEPTVGDDPLAIMEDAAGIYANLHTEAAPAGALRGQLVSLEVTTHGSAEVDDSNPGEPAFGQGPINQNGVARMYVGAPPADGDQVNVCMEIRWPNGLEDGETIGNPAKEAGVHVHTGRVDQNGPIAIAFDGLDGQVDGATCTSTTTDVVQAVLLDLPGHYVNVHTSGYADGIARGQFAPDVLSILTGLEEVGADGVLGVGDPSAFGTGGAFRPSDANPDLVCASFVADGLDRVQAAHVHIGPRGQNGPVVVPITDPLPPPGQYVTQFGCGVPDTDDPEATAAAVYEASEEFYLNVHTETFPNGAVRGQLLAPELP